MTFSSAMRLAATMLLAAGAVGAAQAHPSPVHSTMQKFGAWRLEADADSFSGQTQCRLTARHLSFERDALIVHLPNRVDTMNAVYRLDDGAPVFTVWDEARLATLGFAIRADNLDNPSGGVVRVPLERVGDARQVRVEPRPGKIYRYPLAGLTGAVAAWRTAGCR